EAIVKEAKRQLKYTDKSVKEIAMQMDFPNVSFFGKYFKTHVGVSPMEYRKGK
ncbi:MAG: AraC family transcriptional regulator, partial [Bacteroidaceae bacterium]|nr:AraC family transcriptional regulator [Bacteroidaceae bacterium]